MDYCLVRSDIKNCQSIYRCSNYFLFSGKSIQYCAKQSNDLFKFPNVNYYLSSITPLSKSKLLAQDGKNVYHILDLKNGKVLASQKMRRDVSCTTRFAVSADEKTAFRIWLRGGKHELVIINLADLSYQVCTYHACLNHVADLVYSKEHGLLVLETQVNEDGTCQNQVSILKTNGVNCETVTMYAWSGENTAKLFDGRYVWESGYTIVDLFTSNSFGLLDNSEILLPKKHVALSHIYYPNDDYLQIIDQEQNIFIDCKKRKIIARYFMTPLAGSYKGVLTGNEFWVGKADGIYSKPFPVIEKT